MPEVIWTPPRVDAVRRLRDQGLRNREIAVRLSTTRAKINYVIERHNLERRNQKRTWTDEKLLLLESLASQGFSFNEIGRKMKTTKNAAISAMHRLVKGEKPKKKSFFIPSQKPILLFPPIGVCQYINGDVKTGTAKFCCGRKMIKDSSYCAEHHAVVWRRTG